MGSQTSKLILPAIFAAYAASWFLPIFWGGETLGYEGAKLAMDTLEGGVKYLSDVEVSDPDSVSEALLYIVAGSCNILFAVAALFALFRPAWSYMLAPFAVVSMLVWFSKDVGVGYYLWLLSGVSLFAYSVYMVRKQQRVALPGILIGAWSLPIYAPVVFIGSVYFALFMQEGA